VCAGANCFDVGGVPPFSQSAKKVGSTSNRWKTGGTRARPRLAKPRARPPPQTCALAESRSTFVEPFFRPRAARGWVRPQVVNRRTGWSPPPTCSGFYLSPPACPRSPAGLCVRVWAMSILLGPIGSGGAGVDFGPNPTRFPDTIKRLSLCPRNHLGRGVFLISAPGLFAGNLW